MMLQCPDAHAFRVHGYFGLSFPVEITWTAAARPRLHSEHHPWSVSCLCARALMKRPLLSDPRMRLCMVSLMRLHEILYKQRMKEWHGVWLSWPSVGRKPVWLDAPGDTMTERAVPRDPRPWCAPPTMARTVLPCARSRKGASFVASGDSQSFVLRPKT